MRLLLLHFMRFMSTYFFSPSRSIWIATLLASVLTAPPFQDSISSFSWDLLRCFFELWSWYSPKKVLLDPHWYSHKSFFGQFSFYQKHPLSDNSLEQFLLDETSSGTVWVSQNKVSLGNQQSANHLFKYLVTQLIPIILAPLICTWQFPNSMQ